MKSLLALALLTTSLLSATDRPNVLFIAVDDLRPELATYGTRAITPNLDRLAATGMRFDRAYCNQAVCGASRVSLMGGLYPTKTGEQTYHVTDWRKRHPDLLTMNQHFRASGYDVVGMGKIYHGGNGGKIESRNWDEWLNAGGQGYVLKESTAAALASIRANPGSTGKDYRGTTTEMAEVADTVYADGARAALAAEKIGELASSDEPFFFAVGFTKPHLPFVAPKRYWDLYERDSFSLPENLSWPPGYPDYARNEKAGEMARYSDYEGDSPVDFSDDLNKRLLHGYHACVSYTDANVGKILDALDASGAAENTIVVFWGDHGWKLGDHSTWVKHTNFEADTRVPLILRVPGMTAGEPTDSLVELIDIYPTLCELMGLETPKHLQGESFVSILRDPDASIRASAYSSYPHGRVTGHSIRWRDYRYTEWSKENERKPLAAVFTNLEIDPGEEFNLIDDPDSSSDLELAREELRTRVKEALQP